MRACAVVVWFAIGDWYDRKATVGGQPELNAFDKRNQPERNLGRARSEYAGLLGTGERKASSAARFDGL